MINMNYDIQINTNEEELKIIANNIRKYINDLNTIKNKADQEWNMCTKFLDETTNQNINMVKSIDHKKYLADIENLENYANKLDFISNVLKETEIEIKASAKKFETMLDKMNKDVLNVLNKNN